MTITKTRPKRVRRQSVTASAPFEMRTFEARSISLDSEYHFVGHAATFNQRTAIGNPLTYGFYEQCAPGCFSKSLADKADVLFTQQHDPTKVLARVSNDTLRLAQDATGLAVDSDWAPVSYADDLVILIERRDIFGMSFLFQCVQDRWTIETVELSDGTTADVEVRTLLEVKLIDVCVTANPAYAGTEASMRDAISAAREAQALRSKEVLEAPASNRLRSIGLAITEGRSLTDEEAEDLSLVLSLVAAADDAVDAAQPLIAGILGVPNPDEDPAPTIVDEPSADDDPELRSAEPPDDGTPTRSTDQDEPRTHSLTVAELARRGRALAAFHGISADERKDSI
jgi:HK97 family phage prohead protease